MPPPAPAPVNTGGRCSTPPPTASPCAPISPRWSPGSTPWSASSTRREAPVAIAATRSGNTWTIPQSLAAYPRGNVPNTWRIRLGATPPAGVTYHVNIMQSFVRVGDNPYGPGNVTYPPTTR
ncbi:MAG: hypothetical protein U1F77_02515 [Kiritimatiellia bacterium]